MCGAEEGRHRCKSRACKDHRQVESQGRREDRLCQGLLDAPFQSTPKGQILGRGRQLRITGSFPPPSLSFGPEKTTGESRCMGDFQILEIRQSSILSSPLCLLGVSLVEPLPRTT
ncbi:hypothetical protein HPB47_000426 [Ixodes persulcatus]|uniref:Uncharacterized protein n=1 Tax=Ixodes persulcatus TaxID=34615 RepID=A0AC60PTC2_IXOPE|nr:hypothetical protein HPB47_000426 [Ixodes persulcatus]